MLAWGLFWTCLLLIVVFVFLISVVSAYPWAGLTILAIVTFYWGRHRLRYPLPRHGRRH